MEQTINIGVDLGTTNSVISRYNSGDVIIFRDPISWNEILPSVVAYRKNRIVVGQKAKEFMEKDPQNVFGSFKRKMGTVDEYHVPAINKKISPVDLSAQILKELKSFIPDGNDSNAAVITIPASFDTVQSNATKNAGESAGFNQVVLLQEPIAASLAYANKQTDVTLKNGYWLVYDLGGGTFDVALVRINEEEMSIVDHVGDNYLGGNDFDTLIVEKFIIPYLEKNYTFTNLERELKSASGKYNKEWYIFMKKAEEAKIELSHHHITEIELVLTDENGVEIMDMIEIKREEFEEAISPVIEYTVRMIKDMLKMNKQKIQFILLVGGSTYIPLVRKKLQNELSIEVNTSIDPTTAVAIGAAYYAGTKDVSVLHTEKTSKTENDKKQTVNVNMAYEKSSKDKFVIFKAVLKCNAENKFFRIYREDGGFDTGYEAASKKIEYELPLVENIYNFFRFKLYDYNKNEIMTNAERIGIAQGRYSIVGQPLPDDICLELDSPQKTETRLLTLFKKNTVLPVKKTFHRLINKTIKKDSKNDFIINVLEGSSSLSPLANKTIGFMKINGTQINRNLLKGADIELTLSISESRDMAIVAYIPMLDQTFSQIFTPQKRYMPINLLVQELNDLFVLISDEKNKAIENEEYENADYLNKLQSEIEILRKHSKKLSDDDITDTRYQIEDKKREIARKLYLVGKEKELDELEKRYFEEKLRTLSTVEAAEDEEALKKYKQIISREGKVINSDNPKKIESLINELNDLHNELLWKSDEYIIFVFEWLKNYDGSFRSQATAKSLFDSGYKALENHNYKWLKQIVFQLLNQIPMSAKKDIGRTTGIV